MADLPTPDFSFDPSATGACVAGVRPYRNGSYRLEAETIGSKFIVHNYGHGGAGITLSWGCAAKVRDLVRARLAASGQSHIAVLGAGVMGLTAATMLGELGAPVTIYADRAPSETTSHKAGGQWAVSVVEFQGKERELADIVRIAYTTFKQSIGKGFGVYERPNYTATRSHNMDVVLKLAPGLIPAPTALPRLPFEGHTHSGFVYQTLLIEPPAFLSKLQTDLQARGVHIVKKTFANKSAVFDLAEGIIVNCTGLGAMTLWSDTKMAPIKGQLAMLPPQPGLTYLYGQSGYLFPRDDHVVIGGTFEVGVNNEIADKATCQDLVRHIASLFGKAVKKPLPDNHIHHPDHAPIVNPAEV
ncbi:FAD-binding oxidoreductase [Bradyrhizobium sp. HKCCYLS1011]|uniref:FAD-dependent oxidoreductase n=1 Tax=Bradyrhizobium sp. HKCCYLS1011 TaxID=3420733 RepID=UPI003EB7AEA5